MGNKDYLKIDEDAWSASAQAKIGIEIPGLGGWSIGGGGDHENKEKVSIQEVENYLKENHEYNEWNGEKFITKPMTLSRINLSQLKSSQVITSTSVQVQKFTNPVKRNLVHLAMTCKILLTRAKLETSCQDLDRQTFLGTP